MIVVLKKIFSFDKSLDKKIKFLALLGPFFLLFSLSLASLNLSIIALVGLFLCYRFRTTGLYFALMILFGYMFFKHYNLETQHLWNLGLESSIGLGFIISTFSFEYMRIYLSSFEKENTQSVRDFNKDLLQKEQTFEQQKKILVNDLDHFKNEYKDKIDEIASLKSLNDTLRNASAENLEAKESIKFAAIQKDTKILDLENALEETREKLAFLKDEEYLTEENNELKKRLKENESQIDSMNNLKEDFENKLNLEIDAKKELEEKLNPEQYLNEIENLKRKITSLSNRPKPKYQTNDKKFNEINSLYLQLKNQFHEKSDILHKTRQELFFLREEINAIKSDKSNDYSDLNDLDKKILSDLDDVTQELSYYQKENNHLENLVHHFIDSSKPDNTKKTLLEETQGELPLSE